MRHAIVVAFVLALPTIEASAATPAQAAAAAKQAAQAGRAGLKAERLARRREAEGDVAPQVLGPAIAGVFAVLLSLGIASRVSAFRQSRRD